MVQARSKRQKARSSATGRKARKVRVGVLFGGQSGEHEISLLSAQSVMRAMDQDKYDIVPIGITSEGRWLTGGDPLKALTGGQVTMHKLLEAPLVHRSASEVSRALVPGARPSRIPPVDVIFPVLHGPMGEDGTVQGLARTGRYSLCGRGGHCRAPWAWTRRS